MLLVALLTLSTNPAQDPDPSAASEIRQPFLIQPVPAGHVRFTDTFWKPRLVTNARVTVRACLERCEETGRIANFAVAGGLEEGDFRGTFYDDSDVFKVIEGASRVLASGLGPPDLEQALDSLIEKVAAAQEDDGYLYTIRTIRGPDPGVRGPGPERWSNLSFSHELYNVGHLYEAAVAHFEATGERSLLDVALRNAALIDRVFGPGEEQRKDPPGHQEIEIGLVELYDVTGERRWLDLARWFLERRGRAEGRELYGAYSQDHRPVARQREAVGHAVRATYLYCGMAGVARRLWLLDEPNGVYAPYLSALDRLWDDVVGRKLALTGGIGARRRGEAFGDPFELPNASAYNETCAAIGNALWNHRMFLVSRRGDGRYADVLERILYNGFLSGISLEGDRYFYPNPLACDGRTAFNQGERGRAPWFGCSCCPVNIVRFLPQIPGMVYAVGPEGAVYVNLYVQSEARFPVRDGAVHLVQTTDYPWDGSVRIEVESRDLAFFPLRLRIPGWARGRPVPGGLYRSTNPGDWSVSLRVNGEQRALEVEDGYLEVEREWRPGDEVELEFGMRPRRVVADDRVEANRGRVAFERGPIVYCFEGIDHGGWVDDLVFPLGGPVRALGVQDALGEYVALLIPADRIDAVDHGRATRIEARAIPYALWAHREPGPMTVWAAASTHTVRARPLPTLASRGRASASHVWDTDDVAAVNDQLEPDSSDDHAVPRHTFWPRKGTTEWLQLDLPETSRLLRAQVYWFDDRDGGGCRVPAAWRLLYREDGAWVPVRGVGAYGVERDRFNEVRFEPVRTDALRLEVELQEGFSAGVLEWKLEPR